jgi:erythritol kinase
LRGVLSAAINAPLRVSSREEAGAAGAAMMAAVAIGAFEDMDACVAQWVTPLLGTPEPPDAALAALYDQLFPAFRATRLELTPAWNALAAVRHDAAGGAATAAGRSLAV